MLCQQPSVGKHFGAKSRGQKLRDRQSRADFAQCPYWKFLQQRQQFMDKWLYGLNARSAHRQDNNGNGQRGQILLKLDVLIDRQKDIKLGCSKCQQLAIFDT